MSMKKYPVKKPVELTQELIDVYLKRKVLGSNWMEPGDWICVDVLPIGWQTPECPAFFKTEQEALENCTAHNRYAGYTTNEVQEFIARSVEASNKLYGLTWRVH